MQYSVAVRNAKLNAIDTQIGPSAILRIRTGAKPANCAAADAGTILAEVALPASWMAAASGGLKQKAGTWEDLSAEATGEAGHFRIYDSGGTVCGIQGTIGEGPGGFDMVVDSVSFNVGQPFTVTAFSISDNNG